MEGMLTKSSWRLNSSSVSSMLRVAEFDADGLAELTADGDTEACGAALTNLRDIRAIRDLMATILTVILGFDTLEIDAVACEIKDICPFLYCQDSPIILGLIFNLCGGISH